MKTFTTTLSIFALLISMNAFSNNVKGEITPPLKPRDPGNGILENVYFDNNIFLNTNNITPPLKPRDPGNGVCNF